MIKKRLIVFGVTILALVGMVAAFSKDAVDNMNLGLDLKGGFEILYDVKPLAGTEDSKVNMETVSDAISQRIDALGISEPNITIEGNRIRVKLAGVKDNEEARSVISSNATLSFRDTNNKLLMDDSVLAENGASVVFQGTQPAISLQVADQNKVYEVTSALSQTTDKLMVTWLDYQDGQSYRLESTKEETDEKPAYISAATVSQGLNSDQIVVAGNFSEVEAQKIVDLVNSGSMNFELSEVYSNVVQPSLGENAFDATLLAGIVGIVAVMVFLILVYRLPGVIASIVIAAYTLVVLVLYTEVGGIFTLSGIAALVLGIGMAADSSVITFERIKDCLFQGRSVKQAYKEGSKKTLSTIFDSQVAVLLGSIMLYIFGTGSVQGFATMLMIATVLTMVFNVTIVRFLLSNIVDSGYLDNKKGWFGVKDSDITNLVTGESGKKKSILSKFDFVSKTKYFIGITALVIVIGIGAMALNSSNGSGPFNLGIDFSSGSKITLTSEQAMKSDSIKKDLDAMGIKASDVVLSGKDNKIATISVKKAISEEQRNKVAAYAQEKHNGEASDSTVSPVVNQELVKNAALMALLSCVTIFIYIGFRFKWDYAISSIAAIVYNILVIVAIIALFRMEVTTNIIAVVLAVVTYSINNSIVIFDRIREKVNGLGRKNVSNEEYRDIVNTSLQEVVVRTVITTAVTLIPVICLLILGGSATLEFNIALIIGLLVGAKSSIFIAAQLWYFLRCRFKPKNKPKKKRKKVDEVEEHIIPGVND